MSAPILRARGIGVRFGSVTALDDVSLDLHSGRVTCLLGDNGAGKSTLIRTLAGVHPPSAGTIELDGQTAELATPRVARDRGIETVHQDLAVIPLMPVWRNFMLGREPTRGRGPLRRLDGDAARDRTRAGLSRLAIHLDDVDRPLATLSGGERQSVAIARAVDAGARVLILDEPTAALGVRQSQLVLDLVTRTAEAGVAVLLVTHNPRHALEVGQEFVVLRQGRVGARFGAGEVGVVELMEAMSGDG